MNLSVTISRTLLGLSALQLDNPAAGLAVVSLGPGRREIDLNEVTSPVSDGAVVVGQRAELQTAFITVRAYSTTEAGVLTLIDTLSAAFNQRQYDLTVAIGTRTEVWKCYAADQSVGAEGRWEADRLSGGFQDIAFQVPRLPDALDY